MLAIFDEKIEIRERCKGVHCVDLSESFPTSMNYKIWLGYEYLLTKIGVDTAEDEPRQVCGTGRAREGSLGSLGSLTSLVWAHQLERLIGRVSGGCFRTAAMSPNYVCAILQNEFPLVSFPCCSICLPGN